MQSESVWFEQVDTALVKYVQSKIMLKTKEGLIKSVPVKVRKPDEDFKVEEHPSVTLYNMYSRYAEERYSSEPVIVGRDNVTKKVILENPAIPYDLFYQVDFWSKTQTEMNEMTRQWASQVQKYFNLPVMDVSNNVRDCFVLLRGNLTKDDYLMGYERIFHSMLTYKICVELDEKVQVITPMVTEELIINTITRRFEL